MPRKPEIDWTKFSEAQIAAAKIKATAEKKMTNKELAKQVGVSERQVYRWYEDPDWLEMYNQLCDYYMDTFMGEAYRVLRQKVLEGNAKHMELFLKNRGKLIDRKEVQNDTNITLGIDGKTNDQLLKEIEDAEKRLLGNERRSDIIVEDVYLDDEQ